MSQELRDQELFNQIAAAYARKDVIRSSVIAREYRTLCAVQPVLVARPDLGVVVDIGCGVGAPAKYLYGRYQQYIGIDQSYELIKAGQQFTQGLAHVTFLVANAKTTGLLDNTADVVLSIGALHHMTELPQVLAELQRIAKPGAFLALIEPQNGNPLVQLLRRIRTVVDKSYSEEQIFFAATALHDLLQAQGVVDLQTAYHGYVSTPFAQVVLQPQGLTVPLSRFAVRMDTWLAAHLPSRLRNLSFDMTVVGRFRK